MNISAVIHCERDKFGNIGSWEVSDRKPISDEFDFRRSWGYRFCQVDKAVLMVQ